MQITLANLPSVFLFDIETTESDKLDIISLMNELRDKRDKKKGLGGTLVDPIKIEEKVMEDMSKLALDVFSNQIISFSYSTFDVKPDGQIIQNTNVIFSTNEEELIQEAYTTMEDFYLKNGQIIFAGFGISYFDIPQIRAKILKIKPIKKTGTPAFLPTRKYDMFDMSEILGEGKLDKWLSYFGLQGKYQGIDGSEVPKLFKAGDYETIKKYSLMDARIEGNLLLEMIQY